LLFIIVGNNPSVSRSSKWDKMDKVKHYIRIKTETLLFLNVQCKSDVKYLYV